MFDKKIYKCSLLSITPDIEVNKGLNMKDNIKNANLNVVMNIFVKRTINSNYVREIITNKLIPVYKISKFNTCSRNNGKIIYDVPKSPVFVQVFETIGDEGLIIESGFKEACSDDLKYYSLDHSDKDVYRRELEYYFHRGEKYYLNAKHKNDPEEVKEKRIQKVIKRCNKF